MSMSDSAFSSFHMTGSGSRGGKTEGLLRAWRILTDDPAAGAFDVRDFLELPRSYSISTGMFDEFLDINGFRDFASSIGSQEVLSDLQVHYAQLLSAYQTSRLPDALIAALKELLAEISATPLVVRSSSLLEDHLGLSMPGKYESRFCPNQGTFEENLQSLADAIFQVYASVMSPDAVLYRQARGLSAYQERMAVLIQQVNGRRYRDYFFPAAAGVALSRIPVQWTSRARREDGLVRMVWGLGTRAVQPLTNDYPQLIALSHPLLRPESGARTSGWYAQRFVDLINVKSNLVETLPVSQVLHGDYPGKWLVASPSEDSGLGSIVEEKDRLKPAPMAISFEGLLKQTPFVPLMRAILKQLENGYGEPVDIEFSVDLVPARPNPQLKLCLLQCRPFKDRFEVVTVPTDIPAQDRLFSASRFIPYGHVSKIRYIIYVDPATYAGSPNLEMKRRITGVIGRLNQKLAGQSFILIGPGRWGSIDMHLGVPVTYGEIYNAKMLVEVNYRQVGHIPDPSFGTHFFFELLESNVFTLALYPDDDADFFAAKFFADAPNLLEDLLPADRAFGTYVKVIDVPAATHGGYLDVAMDGENEIALGYIAQRRASESTSL
jgi:hypothetical protein